MCYDKEKQCTVSDVLRVVLIKNRLCISVKKFDVLMEFIFKFHIHFVNKLFKYLNFNVHFSPQTHIHFHLRVYKTVTK